MRFDFHLLFTVFCGFAVVLPCLYVWGFGLYVFRIFGFGFWGLPGVWVSSIIRVLLGFWVCLDFRIFLGSLGSERVEFWRAAVFDYCEFACCLWCSCLFRALCLLLIVL